MASLKTQTIFHSFLYGGASALLAFDLFLLVRSLIRGNFVPLVPVIAGVLLAGGLLFVLFAEQKIREEEKREHRRLSRVATQLEAPLRSLKDDIASITKHQERLPAEVRLKTKQMETRSKVLLENVRDVFLMLRSQEGPIVQETRTYNACVLVKEAVERVKPMADANNTKILERQHCEDAPVYIDKHLFMIAIAHILENAIQYSIRPGLVSVSVLRGRQVVRVLVQDRGIGIKEQDQGAIFNPFARGDKASQYDPDGIGVGLTLSRSIIEEFGGTLTYKDRQDSTGSIFEIRLPIKNV